MSNEPQTITNSFPLPQNNSKNENDILFLKTTQNRHFLLITTTSTSTSSSSSFHILEIERFTGKLLYHQYQLSKNISHSCELEAYEYLSKKYKMLYMKRYIGIIGYQVIGKIGLLLMIKKDQIVVDLYPSHRIKRIDEIEWIEVELEYDNGEEEIEMECVNMKWLKEYDVEKNHYYCETYDMTYGYPSNNGKEVEKGEYCGEFVWNEMMMKEFEMIGMKEICVVLIQGYYEQMVIEKDDKGSELKCCMFCKRSKLNPGTRIKGMNENYSPANVSEIEILLFKEDKKKVKFSTVIFRRGEIPIKWNSVYDNKKKCVKITIDKKKPYSKIEKYYSKYLERYKYKCEITTINLLANNDSNEEELTKAFYESLLFLKKKININIDLVNFDWFNEIKTNGIECSVKKLWGLLQMKIKNYGFNLGTIYSHNNNGSLHKVVIEKVQTGIFRINCDDSLDRTNECNFFLAFPILSQMCKMLGVNNEQDWNDVFKMNVKEIKQNFNSSVTIISKLAELFLKLEESLSDLSFLTSPNKSLNSIKNYLKRPSTYKSKKKERGVLTIDRTHHKQVELFIGVNWSEYFPNYSKEHSIFYVSKYPAFILNDLKSKFPFNTSIEDIFLHFEKDNVIWHSENDVDSVDLNVCLPNYFRLKELSITIRNGISKESSPYKMDVFVGKYYDDETIAFSNLLLPKCEDRTRLIYEFPKFINGLKRQESELYDFNGNHELCKTFRFIKIRFHRLYKEYNLSIGDILITGISTKSSLNPGKKGIKDEKLDKLTKCFLEIDTERNCSINEFVERVKILMNDEASSSSQRSDKNEDEISAGAFGEKREYLKSIKKVLSTGLNFTSALELECIRVNLKISSETRNKILFENGYSIKDFNPSSYIYYHDPIVEKFYRKESKSGNCYKCKKHLKLFGSNTCHYCKKSFCRQCIEKKKSSIMEFKWFENVHNLCIDCTTIIQRQYGIISILNSSCQSEVAVNFEEYSEKTVPNTNILNGNVLLSKFPESCILYDVEKEIGSPPIETILLPIGTLFDNKYWKAPKDKKSVDVYIVLSYFSIIKQLVLNVDKLGYSVDDLPNITVSFYHRLDKCEKEFRWKITEDDSDVVKPCSEIFFDVEDYSKVTRIVKLSISLSDSQKGFIHLGRILVFGILELDKKSFKTPTIPFKYQREYEKMTKIPPLIKRKQIRTTQNLLEDKKIIDIVVNENNVLVSGFRITLQHVSGGMGNHVKFLKVFVVRSNKNKVCISEDIVDTFYIPKVKHNTSLIYDFEKNYKDVYAVRFHLISSYGKLDDVTFCDLFLYSICDK